MEDYADQKQVTRRANARNKYLGTLADTGWLAQQPPRFQDTIASIGRWAVIPAGKRLYSAGDPSDVLIGVDQGHLDLLVAVSVDEECTFFRAGAGDWLAEGGLLFGEPRQLSLETVTPVRVLKVPHTSLRQHLARNPGDWRYLFHLASNRMMMAADLASGFIALPPQARIARQLLRLYKTDGKVVSKQEDLAKLVGISRATFRRAIEPLVQAGAVETSYGRLTVLDRSKVEEIAELNQNASNLPWGYRTF